MISLFQKTFGLRRHARIATLVFGLAVMSGSAIARDAAVPAVHCTSFKEWAETGRGKTDTADDIARGVDLARERHRELKTLITRNPAEALTHRLSQKSRQQLPREVDAELETEVEGIATAGPLRGPLNADANAAPSISLTIKGQVFRTYLHGNQLKKKNWNNVDVRGMAVDGHMVLEDTEPDSAAAVRMPKRVTEVYTRRFDARDLKYSKNGQYDVVTAAGLDLPAEKPGMPVLPMAMLEIAIPSGASVVGVSATGTETDVRGNFVPYPAQPEYPLVEGVAIKFAEPDPAAYASDKITPGVFGALAGDHSMRGFQYVTVRINPLRYLPAGKRLRLASEIKVAVEYDMPLVRPTLKSRKMWESTSGDIRKRVINPEALDTPEVPPLLDASAGE